MPKLIIYTIYKKIRKNRLAATITNILYTRIRPFFTRWDELPRISSVSRKFPVTAFICDDMTWHCFKSQCPSFYITPQNWQKSLEKYRPHVLFCESAWSGISDYKNSWRGQLYKNVRLLYNNRQKLWQILDYCMENGVKTVFWNKEDPFYFEDEYYNFTDTAHRFDHVLTTSAECIPKYHALGVKSVNLWTFGFSPQIFYPPQDESARKNVAIFAGSWFNDYTERCRDMERVFEMVLEHKLELRIYDRMMHTGSVSNKFPSKYEKYIRPPVTYEELAEIYRQAKYVININTVKDSRTMFARRVFEAMACRCIVISNHSDGLKSMFGDRVWFLDEHFNHNLSKDIIQTNVEYVFANHTCNERWRQLEAILEKEKRGPA